LPFHRFASSPLCHSYDWPFMYIIMLQMTYYHNKMYAILYSWYYINEEKHKLVHTINKYKSRPVVEPATSRIWQHRHHQ
jgi:hypothetical protein